MINSASIGNDIISYVYVGDFEIFGIPYPLEVLRDNNIGLWWNFKDSDTLSQTIETFTPVNGGDPVAAVYDKGMHGINGTQPITTKRMKYDIANGVVSSDMVDDGLEVSFPNKIDSAYMVVDNYMGVYTYRINLAAKNSFITTPFVNKYLWNSVKNIFISTTLSDNEQSNVEKYYRNNNTPRIIKDFTHVWNSCSNLTEFPLVDTSAGTIFGGAWASCSGLTEFPLINTSAGTNFFNAWSGCSNLTKFPLIDTRAGTDFSNTWTGCSGLTEFPLINTSAGTNFSYTWNNCSSLTEFPLINTSAGTNFNSAWRGCSGLTEFPLIDISSGTSFSFTWERCSSLTEFPSIDTSAGTNFRYAWSGCRNLESFPSIDTSTNTDFSYTWSSCAKLTEFPLIDTSSGTIFSGTWIRCSGLTTFPSIDTSSGTNFDSTWYNCSGLTEFPSIDTSAGTNFDSTWYSCSNLTKFPLINTSAGTSFRNTWQNCSSLTEFPPNMFNNVKSGNFTSAFSGTKLTEQSIDNILSSLVTSGVSTGTRIFNQTGGSAPSVTIGRPAIDTLRARGWSITVTGGY